MTRLRLHKPGADGSLTSASPGPTLIVVALTFRKLHPHFVAEVSQVDLRQVHDREALAQIRAGMDEYAVLVFRDQPFADDTEFADMRAAYDALPAEIKARLEGLRAHHSIAHSRQTLGFEFSSDEQEAPKGAIHPLVRTIPRSQRHSLYLAAHASRIIDWPVPEGRLLLRDLTEHATQREFVYRHAWRVGDLVIWDNRATMHRGRPFDDGKYRRELRRVTTLDVEQAAAVTSDS